MEQLNQNQTRFLNLVEKHSLSGCPKVCDDPRCYDEYEEYARVSGVDDDEDTQLLNPEAYDD